MVVKHGGRGPGHLSRWPKAASGASLSALALDFTDMDASGLSAAGVTFARASTATRVNSSGLIETVASGAPRFDHDPTDNSPLGLLIEEARTNLLTYSTGFNVNWAGTNDASVDNYATAPDGTTTATRFIDNSGGGTGEIRHTLSPVTVSTTTTYTFSLFCKEDQLSWVALGIVNFTTPASGWVWFDLNTGSVGTENTGLSGKIEDAGGGWYRCSVTFTTGGSDTSGEIRINLADANGARTAIDLDGTSSILIWGAQLEVGSFPTSYIPTAGSTATRAASTAIDTDNLADWNASAGTIVATFRSAGSGTKIIWQADDNTANERFTLYTSGTSLKFAIVDGGVTVCDITIGTVTAGAQHKAAVAWAADDVAGSLDGATEVTDTDTSGGLPTVTRCRFGSDTTGNQLCGHLEAFDYYTTRQADVEALAT